jgi:hypothetical protein
MRAVSNEYQNNHYVPAWYQKRFLPVGQKDKELYYLDFQPGYIVDPRGISHPRRAVRRQGFGLCFAEKDLYTTRFGAEESKNIEKQFFGQIDNTGCRAVDLIANFSHGSAGGDVFQDLVMYMSTQKLRTPKGLEWLALQSGAKDKALILSLMIHLRQLHCAIWTECVWLIADASQSATKFIVSDHPVTVYNRRCGPRSQWCRGANDPDIRFHATHTIFPLSLEKILILTNLSWARNPYQSETGMRPNPNPFRGALFNLMDIQVLRHLNEQEVREINFIIKSRARRFVGAGQEEWLFPEQYVSKSNWNTYGDGYLLMPDPRDVHFTGEVIMGFKDGRSTGFDPYGRRPWERDFGKEGRERSEFGTLYRFKGEFARLFGPVRRGRSYEFGDLSKERDDDWFHQYHLSLEKKKRP